MRDGYLRGSLARPATQRQMDVLAAYEPVKDQFIDPFFVRQTQPA
jgi:hypothetical protein